MTYTVAAFVATNLFLTTVTAISLYKVASENVSSLLPPSQENLACPQSPFWFSVQIPEPICSDDSECLPTEKCCYFGDNKHCRLGIDMTSKLGTCPVQVLSAPGEESCIADFPGCQYDSECSGTDKCCLNVDCRYKECKPIVPLMTEKMNLACPQSPFWFPVQIREPICSDDSECQPAEKCCYYGDNKHCRLGIEMTSKLGTCPVQVLSAPGEESCMADFSGCQYDSECSGTDKCCLNVDCRYKECKPIVPLMTTESPTNCTRQNCTGPPAGPACKNIETVRPNGEGCEPMCTICRDDQVSKENLACPQSPFWFSAQFPEPICIDDSECQPAEKCCYYGDNKHCRLGIDMTPKAGFCPVKSSSLHKENDCAADFIGCQHDAECSGADKCCKNFNCGYNECKSVAPLSPPPPAPIKVPICQTRWNYVCPEDILSSERSNSLIYKPTCRYVRQTICE
ncbi:keratin-associated protein 16-1-like [Watersipora subatra]|uniref:keratin-associated protein 16-1-like n=1 Tax=Watersipora subatra TaxID=2589382 RepID=UPI00355B2BEA